MAFSPGITVESSENRLIGFSVNGKNLDCPGRELFLSNEIRIIETASPTTFRNRLIRVPARAESVDPNFTQEVLQSGDIPPPMYGSTLTSIKLTPRGTTGPSGQAVLVGGSFLRHAHKSVTELMFDHVLSNKESTWAEESSGGVWILEWSMEPLNFHWRKVLDIEPRTFHKAVLIGKSLLVFGGTNILTGDRHSLIPVNINTETWQVLPLQTGLLADTEHDPTNLAISAHSMMKTSDNSCIGIGGYRLASGQVGESPADEIFSCEFNLTEEGAVDSFLTFQSRLLNSGPVAHNFILNTPSATCALVAGGTIERWAILCKNTLPGDPCDLFAVGKCKVFQNQEPAEDTVRWIGCDGPCKRWFHSVVCLKMSEIEAKAAEQMKNWFCRRADCKKK